MSTTRFSPSLVGSYPEDYRARGSDDSASDLGGKPKILLMGLRRSGKSSIRKVVFHKMSPNETLFLESTNKIQKEEIDYSSYIQFSVWDFPGQVDFFDPSLDVDELFGNCGAMVFVIDSQDDYSEALSRLQQTVTRILKVNPKIEVEVFIHKVDGLSDDTKIDTQRDIHQRANDDMADVGLNVELTFHLTSIYNHSIFEAFSKVVQKLLPQMASLENLLNIFTTNSGVEKSFLFDIVSKIYIATDSINPVDMQSYELCCDMVDMVIDLTAIYGEGPGRSPSKMEGHPPGRRGSSFDESSFAVIRLQNGTALYLREVNRYMALVCLFRGDIGESEPRIGNEGIVEHNFTIFRNAIRQIFELSRKPEASVHNTPRK